MQNTKQVEIRVSPKSMFSCKEKLEKLKKEGNNIPPLWQIIESCALIKLNSIPENYTQAYIEKNPDLYYKASNLSKIVVGKVKHLLALRDGNIQSFFSEAFEEYWDTVTEPLNALQGFGGKGVENGND